MKIEVRHLSFSYGSRPVLRDVSFSASEGQLLSVLGANGVGKSTLFRCLLGLLSHYDGEILLDGQNIRNLSPRERAKRIAYIPQSTHPAFGYSVLEMVLMGTTHTLSAFSAPKKEQIEQAQKAMRYLGIEHLADRNYAHLSGGEQQIVLIARALSQQSRILVMDEPTASLDYGNQLLVLCRVRSLAEDGYTVLLSTHHPQHALTYSNHVLALKDGKVAAFGETKTVLTKEMIETLYGVQADFIDTGRGRVIAPISFENTILKEEQVP